MSEPADFNTRLKHYQSRVDSALEALLPHEQGGQHQLIEAMRYSVIGGGGKRIRPAMVYAAGTAVGVNDDILDTPACAVELMHTYSLIHDDLPSMDDDDLRRGQPTCHKQFHEATAILAGDALQALAFEILAGSNLPFEQQRQLEMISLLSTASGAGGMAGGQAMDLAAVGNTLSLDQLESIGPRHVDIRDDNGEGLGVGGEFFKRFDRGRGMSHAGSVHSPGSQHSIDDAKVGAVVIDDQRRKAFQFMSAFAERGSTGTSQANTKRERKLGTSANRTLNLQLTAHTTDNVL